MAIEASRVSNGSKSPLLARLRDTFVFRRRIESTPESESNHDLTRGAPGVAPSQAERIRPNVGRSVRFKGDINGDGDVDIDGTLDGSVTLPANSVTVRSAGCLKGGIKARNVFIAGKVNGDITAHERIELEASAQVDGNVKARRISVRDGARITGRVEVSEASLSAGPAADGPAIDSERQPNVRDLR